MLFGEDKRFAEPSRWQPMWDYEPPRPVACAGGGDQPPNLWFGAAVDLRAVLANALAEEPYTFLIAERPAPAIRVGDRTLDLRALAARTRRRISSRASFIGACATTSESCPRR